jgi:hypothetical protein
MARAWASSAGLNVVSSTPVSMLYASRFARGTVFVPGAAPAGRAVVNLPAT